MTKKIDWTKPLEKVDGVDVFYVGKLPNANGLHLVSNSEGSFIYGVDDYGKSLIGHQIKNVPETLVRYINIYSDGQGNTREEADGFADNDRIACIRVEVEIGQFDD